jgi:hypothetical protein
MRFDTNDRRPEQSKMEVLGMMWIWFRKSAVRSRAKSPARWAVVAAGLALAAAVAGCGGLALQSVWRQGDVAIDGTPAEWEGATTWVENPNVAIGVVNDQYYLYICLSSPVRSIVTQVVRNGLTVWFDAEGKKGKKVGIRCPLGAAPPGKPGAPGAPRAPVGLGEADKIREVAGDSDQFRAMIARDLAGAGATIEVIGPGEGDVRTVKAGEAGGIEVALGYVSGRLIYEIKVPLRRSEAHPYGIGWSGDGQVGIGFETPEITVEAPDGAMQGGPGPGGDEGDGWGGGGPGGEGGAGGGPPGGGRRPGGMNGPGGPGGAPEPLEVWGKIRLAEGQG